MSGSRDGVLLVDKPAGITSHDVVARVRRVFGRGVKVGHAGTLDPFATGLLLVLVGRGTRIARFLLELPKTYEVVARFGWVSSTGDIEGELTETGSGPTGDLVLPVGEVRQRPPAYSAVKIGGRRAYSLAREGIEVEMPERVVSVYRFEERWREGERRAFVIECSSGTYVRSLIADLGDAYCLELRRTGIGDFDVARASDIERAPDQLIGLSQALSFLPAIVLSGEDAVRARHGRPVELSEPLPDADLGAGARGVAGAVRLLDDDGLIALARHDPERGALRTVVGFRG